MSLRYISSFILLGLFLFINTPVVIAQSALSQPFSPWMERKQTINEPLNKPIVEQIKQSHKKSRKHLSAIPKAPVLTPEDTRKIIAQIYSDTEPPSRLEQTYSDRIVDELGQFGYDLFGTPEKTSAPNLTPPAGAVQDDFVLNSGDRLDVTFRGQRSDRKIYDITNQGTLIIDDLPPLPAAGRTIGQLRQSLNSQMTRLHNTDVFISLESVRQINILIVGQVHEPGRQTLTVFHSVLDALTQAGGIKKTGSLRQIKLVRNGRSTIIDLYGLLIHGSTNMDLQLRDGDRIIIPPIGPTVAIAGGVKQPGIYEILPGLKGMKHKPQQTSSLLSLQDMLDMTGGLLQPGQNRFLKLGLTENGSEIVEEIFDSYQPVFKNASILMVAPSDEMRVGTIELAGHTRRPGLHALTQAKTLSALIENEKTFGPDIYPLIGVIERWNEGQLAKQLIDFPPLLVLKGQFDSKLQEGDVVHLFSRTQILALQRPQEEENNEMIAVGSLMALPDEDALSDPVIASFLNEHGVFIRGAVRQPGTWPVAEGNSLKNLIAVSGGLTLEANTSNIELTSNRQQKAAQRLTINFKETDPGTVMVGPGDTVRINQKFRKVEDNSVLIIGEISHPGRYDLMPGDTMLQLLRRAGGLSAQAYPDGTIFSRESERRTEEARFRAKAQELEIKLAAALEQDDEPDTAQINAVQGLVTQLKHAEAVGRITVESDPGMLSTQPELDILLESGDRIFVPKRPLTVKVNGEVLSPASLQFRKNKGARDYIMEAGGYSYHADKDRVFVLYPDGSAQPLQISPWKHSPLFIPPGSSIVVPRDPKPFDFIEAATDISQIFTNLAITGIFLDDIRDDD